LNLQLANQPATGAFGHYRHAARWGQRAIPLPRWQGAVSHCPVYDACIVKIYMAQTVPPRKIARGAAF
jgi:hypothetical protein